jgi:hypothetical protein
MDVQPVAGTAGVDFFRYGALPVPQVTVEEAERLAASSFGLMVRARPSPWPRSRRRTPRRVRALPGRGVRAGPGHAGAGQ